MFLKCNKLLCKEIYYETFCQFPVNMTLPTITVKEKPFLVRTLSILCSDNDNIICSLLFFYLCEKC